jgi:DNA-binding NtrC family response regulator/HPt (histidine-containing phosphotransfer) domain-containing protein
VEQVLQRQHRARALDELRVTGGRESDPAFSRLSALPSASMVELCSLIRRFSASNLTVLVCGETGTGKELVARAVHGLSERKSRPFVTVNCGAIAPELVESELFGHSSGAFTGASGTRRGLVREAAGGTLFLDEVGELPLATQPKLLRLLQEGEVRPVGSDTTHKVDVRVVAATHVDLEGAVRERRFREDLFHRLAVLHLDVPALRDRRSDILLLAEGFLREAAEHAGRAVKGFENRALRALLAAPWPGNVRELQNRVRRAAVISAGSLVSPEDLGFAGAVEAGPEPLVTFGGPLLAQEFHAARDAVMALFETQYVANVLTQTGGNVAEAARRSGLPRKSLWRIACRNGLDADKASRRAGQLGTEGAAPGTAPPEDRLAAARKAYLAHATTVVEEFERRLNSSPGLADWMWVEGEAHRLLGSAGSFGYPAASAAARELCDAARGVQVTASLAALGRLVGALEAGPHAAVPSGDGIA